MYGLNDLLQDYGYDEVTDFMNDYGLDSIVPGICVECGATYEYEPDQARGWCECCESNTVKSGLVVLGII